MNYLGPKILGNFRTKSKRRPRARDRREGMSREHVRLVAMLPSCISGLRPCDPHHLRVKEERGVGLRATDRWCVPLTREEHRLVHTVGSRKEEEWFQQRGVDPRALATLLWNATGDLVRMSEIVEEHQLRRGARSAGQAVVSD
jgi:hypothetical protein